MATENAVEQFNRPDDFQNDDGFQDDELGLARLAAFSDGVFAIAITLLVLDIRLPELPANVSDSALLDALWEIKDRYYSYLISFFVIGLYWVWHHRMYRHIVRYNITFIALNLLMLLFVAFLPFPTSLISDYDNKVATIFYALSVSITGLVSVVMWAYASNQHRLINKSLSEQTIFRITRASASIPVLLLVSAVVALWSVGVAKIIWIFIAVAIIF